MFFGTRLLQGLRPRQLQFTPPKLSRRTGDFRCGQCKTEWFSDKVWVTELTHKCFQGQSCEQCGTTVKPYYVGFLKETIFNRRVTPHVVGHGKSTARRYRNTTFYKQKKATIVKRRQ
jgi:hypothetical protein